MNSAIACTGSADEPYPTALARCVATRLGNGGQAGTARPKGVRKFMVEFKGEPLARLPAGVMPEPVLWASRGEFSNILTEAVPNDVPGHWRAEFDLTVDRDRAGRDALLPAQRRRRCSARPGCTSTTRRF